MLALVPRVVTAVMQTTMIRASMTAYSTAVGPLSSLMKSATAWVNLSARGGTPEAGGRAKRYGKDGPRPGRVKPAALDRPPPRQGGGFTPGLKRRTLADAERRPLAGLVETRVDRLLRSLDDELAPPSWQRTSVKGRPPLARTVALTRPISSRTTAPSGCVTNSTNTARPLAPPVSTPEA